MPSPEQQGGRKSPPKRPSTTTSIRLNLSSNQSESSKSTGPSPKRRRFAPVSLPPHTASVSENTLFHQVTGFQFVLDQPLGSECKWYCRGRTSIYMASDSPAEQANRVSLALHLRKSCRVKDVSVEYMTKSGLSALNTTFFHCDPLHNILVKPPTSYTDDSDVKFRFNADSQSSRGAAGMTTALRGASIASNMGELRISAAAPTGSIPSTAEQLWAKELSSTAGSDGAVVQRLKEQLATRCEKQRKDRIKLVAQRLAKAMTTPKGNRAFKVTVQFEIPLPDSINHLGGIHSVSTDNTPHIYTTSGSFGDHEGARCWLPCVDSASWKHRYTHEISIKVTAPYRHGVSCIGAGQDFGCSDTLLHEAMNATASLEATKRELGNSHVAMLMMRSGGSHSGGRNRNTHVIPLEGSGAGTTTIDSIQATHVWCSQVWSPAPVRSLGFAIGPFKVLEDTEYFGPSLLEGLEDDDDEEGNDEGRLETAIEAARKNGEGIRQCYLAPLFERKNLLARSNTILLPNIVLQLSSLSREQEARVVELDNIVSTSTVGVPHRALSLTRDVLAVPTYRTASYTQVWIPNAVHGGSSCGALNTCPEVLVNPFLGGSIMDSRLLPPPGSRLPFHQGGRVMQCLQARNVMRGWITAALPLGGNDDVGMGYLHSLVESLFMSLYERGHGAQGEGGAAGGVFFSKRFTTNSGLNSPNLDSFPIQNIEDVDVVVDGVGAVPVEDRHNEQLWRAANNGTESHTSGMDEFNVRQVLTKDFLESLERGTDKDKGVPLPSMGWFGSHLSLSFLSSNASSSSELGCGAVDMVHPIGGLVYRRVKSDVLRGVVEGRAGIANFVRLVRAAFIAAHLDDVGQTELRLPSRRDNKKPEKASSTDNSPVPMEPPTIPHQPFVLCVNEILKKRGLTHNLFIRALRNLCGRIKEPYLVGAQVDVERHAEDPRTRRPFVDPEGFPNSYVRGSSMFYCRVGVHVEAARDVAAKDQGAAVAKGIQMQAYAEPIIPEGGTAFGGPITVRVVENEGQFREYVKELSADGSRKDWGTTFLHAKPVTTGKAQTAASGTLEGGKDKAGAAAGGVFTESQFHRGGFQAIELIRLTNLSPLLWVRVDPMGLYGGRISVFQPDACLAEQLYHDGDAGAQVDAIRSMAERPLRIQASTKATAICDVSVSELPVRILGDCLRGSPAIHSSLPHTPVVRTQAALAIAQWQNNKAPASKNSIGADGWTGLTLLLQYFKERFFSNGTVMPVKFSRLALRTGEAEVQQAPTNGEAAGSNTKTMNDDSYHYLDSLEEGEERAAALEDAEDVEMEEDEEYRVRSSVVTAIACVRAKDGQTPPKSIEFLETLLEAEDAEMLGHLVYPDEELMEKKTAEKRNQEESDEEFKDVLREPKMPSLSYVACTLIADALLALSHVNSRPEVITDPATGKQVQTTAVHPLSRLIKSARSWLDWEMYRERIRLEIAREEHTGLSGNCFDMISSCAIVSLANLIILKQCTTDVLDKAGSGGEDAFSGSFYMNVYNSKPLRNELIRAASAQALACICCAADRVEKEGEASIGLLTALEFILEKIVDPQSSPSLRQALSLIMMDACTGKVCSMQRVGSVAGRNDLITSGTRFFNGPLGAGHGGDNGSALLMDVTGGFLPAAQAVNNGARRGLRLLSRAGHPREVTSEEIVVRVARFATRLWRTINGEQADPPANPTAPDSARTGVCAFDGTLRVSLLALWQWIWPRGCYAILQVQSWKARAGQKQYQALGAQHVMQISEDEKKAAAAEENASSDINRLVNMELDRQVWRGEMVKKAYDMSKFQKSSADVAATEQGIGQPLPPIQRDSAYRHGGWIASAAHQRRAMALDGGTAVTKLRLKVKSSTDD